MKHPTKNLSSSRSTILFDYRDTLYAVIYTHHDHQLVSIIMKWEDTKEAIEVKIGVLMDYPYGFIKPGSEVGKPDK